MNIDAASRGESKRVLSAIDKKSS